MNDSARNRMKNPYIIGRPIEERQSFFGRESLFRFIEDNLQQKVKVILLHGQRRIGKSSVLKQIPQFFAELPHNDFVFVNFDLQDKAKLSLSQLLYSLATEIIAHVDDPEPLADNRITLPPDADLENDLDIFSRNFLPQVYEVLGDKNLVLLLDEFDVLNDARTPSVEDHFFPYLKELINQHEKLFIIPVVGRNLGDMPKLLSLFGRPPYQEIALLEEVSAKRLITRPSRGMLEYDSDAIQAIIDLSAGHPYFTQIICCALFGQARDENKSKVTRLDVEGIVERAIENAEGGLDWFWKGLPTPEQVVFSSVAEAQRIAISEKQWVPEEPLKLLKSYGVVKTNSLIQAAHQLAEKGFLDNTERRVKIELVRRWLVQRHPLGQEICQLEQLEQEEVNPLWKVATELREQGKKRNAIARYEQILEINPNHFSNVVALAEGYLEVGELDKAVELYTRAYQFNPIRNQQGLLHALQISGQQLITQREFTQAKEQFKRVLEIEPDNQAGQEMIHELEGGSVETDRSPNLSPQSRRIQLGGIAVVAGIIAFVCVGVGVYEWIVPCSSGEQKVFGVGCAADSIRISRGERTLFPQIKNTARDQGIAAFKQGNYAEAAELFKRSVAANRNDPELLIYYNNARAKQGSRFTLAVVVPVDVNNVTSAQEILRGVAQAQNQFNENGGFKNQLLEIAIANDSDDPDKAKHVAQDLVKDSSVLGVIGHSSSDSTKAALSEYKNAGLPIISPTSTSTWLTGNVFFRTVPSDKAIGKTLAEYATNDLHLKKVVIFYSYGSSYSESLRDEFLKNFGGKVVPKIYVNESELDVEQELKNSFIDQAQAAVLFPDIKQTLEALKIAKANADLTAKLPNNANKQGLKLLGGDALYSQKILQDGKNTLDGLILAVPWFREARESITFAKAAAERWGGNKISWRTATSFDATQAFIKALSSSSNPSKKTVLQNLQNVNIPASETSGEILKFQQGERQSKPILVKVEKGKFKLVNY